MEELGDHSLSFFFIFFFLFELLHRVVETLKDYASKALISTVDHLGSVAYKVGSFLDKKVNEMSATRLQFSCLEQVPIPYTGQSDYVRLIMFRVRAGLESFLYVCLSMVFLWQN